MAKRIATVKHFLGAFSPAKVVQADGKFELRRNGELLASWSIHPAFEVVYHTEDIESKLAKWIQLWQGVRVPDHGAFPAHDAKADVQHLLVALAYA